MKKDEVTQTELVPPVQEEQEQLEKKVSTVIYQLYLTGDLIEYYSYTLPTILPETVMCNNIFKRETVMEEVLGETVEESYIGETSVNVLTVDLSDGFSIKAVDGSSDEMKWVNRTKAQAEELVKDKILSLYQKVVPSLMENVNYLREELDKVKRFSAMQEQHSQLMPPPQRPIANQKPKSKLYL